MLLSRREDVDRRWLGLEVKEACVSWATGTLDPPRKTSTVA
jgi:hypothetical protein